MLPPAHLVGQGGARGDEVLHEAHVCVGAAAQLGAGEGGGLAVGAQDGVVVLRDVQLGGGHGKQVTLVLWGPGKSRERKQSVSVVFCVM